MRIDIITLFPEVFTPLDTSIVKRAIDKGLQRYLSGISGTSKDKHKKVDDTPYGGSKGMYCNANESSPRWNI